MTTFVTLRLLSKMLDIVCRLRAQGQELSREEREVIAEAASAVRMAETLKKKEDAS